LPNEKIIEELTVDTTQAKRELQQLEHAARMTAATVLDVTKRGYQSITLMMQLLGQQVPMAVEMIAQAAFLVAETLITLASAEAITGIGVIKAGINLAMAYVLFNQAFAISAQAKEITQRANTAVQLMRVWI
jgi:hypothetical protein